MKKEELDNFLEKIGPIFEKFIETEGYILPFEYDQCPMLIVKVEVGVSFYLQLDKFDNTRDYSRIKELALESKPILSKMLEEVRDKKLLSKI